MYHTDGTVNVIWTISKHHFETWVGRPFFTPADKNNLHTEFLIFVLQSRLLTSLLASSSRGHYRWKELKELESLRPAVPFVRLPLGWRGLPSVSSGWSVNGIITLLHGQCWPFNSNKIKRYFVQAWCDGVWWNISYTERGAKWDVQAAFSSPTLNILRC